MRCAQDEVVELLSQSMARMTAAPGFLIDGFPANLAQAELFISRIQAPHKIIVLDVPEAVMGPRLKDGVNFNDSDETIKKRIFTYLEHTKPTIESITKKWTNISKTVSHIVLNWCLVSPCMFSCQIKGDRSKDAVFSDLEKVFDSWVGEHGAACYTVVCEECNRNTVTLCPHLSSLNR